MTKSVAEASEVISRCLYYFYFMIPKRSLRAASVIVRPSVYMTSLWRLLTQRFSEVAAMIPSSAGSCAGSDFCASSETILNCAEIRYTQSEVETMCARLKLYTDVPTEEREKHVENIRKRTDGTVCPYCGSQLVLRTGKDGQFYGCTGYPKCRFTRQVK